LNVRVVSGTAGAEREATPRSVGCLDVDSACPRRAGAHQNCGNLRQQIVEKVGSRILVDKYLRRAGGAVKPGQNNKSGESEREDDRCDQLPDPRPGKQMALKNAATAGRPKDLEVIAELQALLEERRK